MGLADIAELLELWDYILQFSRIKPTHFSYFSQQHDHHLLYLFIKRGALSRQEIQDIVLDSDLFLHRDHLPVLYKAIFE